MLRYRLRRPRALSAGVRPCHNLRARARSYLERRDDELTERARELGINADLGEVEGVSTTMMVRLGEKGVLTRDDLADMTGDELAQFIRAEMPVWVHNVITDPGFPERDRLSMSLRRFEGELRDNRDNEVVASVLSAGFRNRDLDPLNPPATMPMRQRCALLMHMGPWREAYEALERDWVSILSGDTETLDAWMAAALADPELQPEAAVAI